MSTTLAEWFATPLGRYLRERDRLGTAGALSLLPEAPNEPFIVTNADLLTKEDYGEMIDRPVIERARATLREAGMEEGRR